MHTLYSAKLYNALHWSYGITQPGYSQGTVAVHGMYCTTHKAVHTKFLRVLDKALICLVEAVLSTLEYVA